MILIVEDRHPEEDCTLWHLIDATSGNPVEFDNGGEVFYYSVKADAQAAVKELEGAAK